MKQIITAEESERFSEDFLKILSEKAEDVYAKTKIARAVRGEEKRFYLEYFNGTKNIQTELTPVYLMAIDSESEGGLEKVVEKYAGFMRKEEKMDFGSFEHLKATIFPMLLNAEYIKKTVSEPVEVMVRDTEFSIMFVYSDIEKGESTSTPLTKEDVEILFSGDMQALTMCAFNNAEKKLGLQVLADTNVKNVREARKSIYQFSDKNRGIFSSLGLITMAESISKMVREPLYIFPYSPDNVVVLPRSMANKKKIRMIYDMNVEKMHLKKRSGVMRLSDKIYTYDPTMGLTVLE